jgi:hypothetical protein
MAKRNHIQAALDATHAALGVDPAKATSDAPAAAKPSRLAGFSSKAPASTGKAPKPAKAAGATAKALKQLAKGDW